jgi:2',3'-cyclic-nucleotide 2'-phosphodiesterase (5'-nucleotidase family)
MDAFSTKMVLRAVIIVSYLLLTINGNSQDLMVVYTGNLNGYLEPCNCEQAYLGGMTRLVTAVDSLRREYPDLILLDSGDFLKSYPLPAGNWLMMEMMAYLNYEAIALGEQELVEGSQFLFRALDHFSLPVLNGNLRFHGNDEQRFSASTFLHRGDFQIGIVSLVDSNSFEFSGGEKLTVIPEQLILPEVLKQIPSTVDLLFLLYHGTFEKAVVLAKKFSEIDIIIAGHAQVRTEGHFGNQIVVQNGFDGEYLGILKIDFQDSSYVFTNSFLPIDKTFCEHRYFKNRIRQVLSDNNPEY